MDESAGFRANRAWLLVLLGLLVGQGWLTLRLFTPDLSVERLLNDEPILSGQHPLHLYHGQLAAKTWRERGTSSCYDPAFQAGYPKTPVFDPGSRPAELFLLAARGSPAAYKVGLALCCLLVPAGFALMGRGIGLPAGPCRLPSARSSTAATWTSCSAGCACWCWSAGWFAIPNSPGSMPGWC
jgi:hypothetical protein